MTGRPHIPNQPVGTPLGGPAQSLGGPAQPQGGAPPAVIPPVQPLVPAQPTQEEIDARTINLAAQDYLPGDQPQTGPYTEENLVPGALAEIALKDVEEVRGSTAALARKSQNLEEGVADLTVKSSALEQAVTGNTANIDHIANDVRSLKDEQKQKDFTLRRGVRYGSAYMLLQYEADSGFAEVSETPAQGQYSLKGWIAGRTENNILKYAETSDELHDMSKRKLDAFGIVIEGNHEVDRLKLTYIFRDNSVYKEKFETKSVYDAAKNQTFITIDPDSIDDDEKFKLVDEDPDTLVRVKIEIRKTP